jgi:predicted nucleic acid-binding protein
MSDRAFIDTNVFVYLSAEDDPQKRQAAKNAIDDYDCVVSTQVVNELSSVLLRKYGKSIMEVKDMLEAIETTCEISLITLATTEKALNIHEHHKFSFYDSLIIAAALENDCKFIISEDFHSGTKIENDLTILNVFS